MHPLVNIATKAAFAAGEVITRHLYKLNDLKITEKEANHFVSEVDIKAEQIIVDTIRKVYPHHGILAEEGGNYQAIESDEESDYLWIIDPLDGTHNYLHGMPHYAVSIALQIKNRIEHAVIYDPQRNECFSASRGCGAVCNEHKLRVAQRPYLKDALLGASFSSNNKQSQDEYLAAFQAFFNQCLGMRRTGSAALDLAYVAAGRLDGLWAFGLQPWDMAAGSLLIKESGGLVTDFQGGEDYMKKAQIAAGNPKILKAILQTLQPTL